MTSRTRVHLVAAARPNFMKVAPVWHELSGEPWCEPVLVHTGQHYDTEMSDTFLDTLGLPDPVHHLGVGSGSHAKQTAAVMSAYDDVLRRDRPDWVVVVGDVNSTLACALTATKEHVPVAHLEAGLRSFDRTMPEEINRIVTDAVADLLWTPSADADENLAREGIPENRIERVGNIMIDSFEMLRDQIEAAAPHTTYGFGERQFGVVTFHRPSNVDHADVLSRIVDELEKLSREVPIVFPLHPRTRDRLVAADLLERLAGVPGVHLTVPLGYVEFLGLVLRSAVVVTDSGGIQEETTYLGIPCLTVRSTTERPVTVTAGTNQLIAPEFISSRAIDVVADPPRWSGPPDLWDGSTAKRVAASLWRRSG